MKVQILLRIFRGYSIIGNTLILHINIPGSNPGFSIAREAQLVEHNTEDIMVVSSNLAMST